MLLAITAVFALPTIGFCIGWAMRGDVGRPVVRALPPATARQIDRARRANRADLSRVRQPIPALFVSPAADDFDSEETR